MTEERAKKVLQEQIEKYGQEYDTEGIEALEMAIKALEQQPKTGHWEYGYAFPDGQYCRCSECEELIKCIYPMHYCPNCGAKMAESEE